MLDSVGGMVLKYHHKVERQRRRREFLQVFCRFFCILSFYLFHFASII